MLSLHNQDVAGFKRKRALFAGFLSVALAVISACSGGDGDPGLSKSLGAGAVALRPVTANVQAAGAARIVGRGAGARLALRVERLPPHDGAYEVWLYNSIFDAVGVARVARGSFALRARLPRDPARYRYVDISREPLDDNRLHSGASVLRVRMSRLLAAARR